MRYYRLDLVRDLGTDALSWRRLAVLVARLPRESSTMRDVHGAAVEWGPVEHLLATAVDVLAAANWQRGGDKKAPRPKPLLRPGVAAARRQDALNIRERLLDQRRRLAKAR